MEVNLNLDNVFKYTVFFWRLPLNWNIRLSLSGKLSLDIADSISILPCLHKAQVRSECQDLLVSVCVVIFNCYSVKVASGHCGG